MFYVFQIMALLSAAIAFAVILKFRKNNTLLVFPAFALGLVFGFLLGKLIYLLCNTYLLFDGGTGALFSTDPAEFSLVGGFTGFVLGLLLILRIAKIPAGDVMDRFSAPFCLAFAFIMLSQNHADYLGLAEFSTFGLADPVFGIFPAVYPLVIQAAWDGVMLSAASLEALAALLCIPVSLTMLRKSREKHFSGMIFQLCISILCAVHMFFEPARTVSIVFYFVHVEQVLCAVILLVLLLLLRSRCRTGGGPRCISAIVVFWACIVVNGLIQFMLDKPWLFFNLLPESITVWLEGHLSLFCYTVMLLTALILLINYLLLFRKFNRRHSDKA